MKFHSHIPLKTKSSIKEVESTIKIWCFSYSMNSHQFSSASQLCLAATLWTAACQASMSNTKSQACSNSCSLCRWCHPNVSSSVVPFFSCLQSFPASGSFPKSQLFKSGGQSTGVSASVFQWISMTDFLLDGLVQPPCSTKDSQESSPTPQLKCINSSVLSFLYSPILTSIHDYWKNHSFD